MKKKLLILVALPTLDNDFQVEQACAAEEAAQKLKVDIHIVYADNDAVTQSTQVLKSIQAVPDLRPDAVVLGPVGSDALPRVARAACEAGIGWAVLNRSPSYVAELRGHRTAPIFSITSDHREIGRIQGRQFAALLPEGGWVLYIEGPAHSTSARMRTDGMLETKPLNINVRTLRGQWTEESAERTVRSWLNLATSKKATVDLIGAQDDSMAMGARKALEGIVDASNREAWMKLPFTGCDGVPKTGQTWVRNGLLAATIYNPPLAGAAVEALVRAIREGYEPPEQSKTLPFSIPALTALRPWNPPTGGGS